MHQLRALRVVPPSASLSPHCRLFSPAASTAPPALRPVAADSPRTVRVLCCGLCGSRVIDRRPCAVVRRLTHVPPSLAPSLFADFCKVHRRSPLLVLFCFTFAASHSLALSSHTPSSSEFRPVFLRSCFRLSFSLRLSLLLLPRWERARCLCWTYGRW